MNSMLCSVGYQKFFDALPDYSSSLAEYLEKMHTALSYVAQEVSLGRVEYVVKMPAQLYIQEEETGLAVLYESPAGYGGGIYTETFFSEEQGETTITVYPIKNRSWTEAERESVRFLARNIYLLSGRILLMELTRQAVLIDNMTGAANAEGLMQYGKKLQAAGCLTDYTGVMFNIKNYKYFNQIADTQEGDEVLRKYAGVIQEFLCGKELLVRLGGDNFFVLLQKGRLELFLEKLARVTISVNTPGGSREFDIAARAGVYIIQKTDAVSEVMNKASVALNVARASRNHDVIWFREQMQEKSMQEKRVSIMFPKALEQEEFLVYYQPKVSLPENRLCGCEALVRWLREGKIVPPMEFLPVLEREGSICALDFYVFEKVCCDIRKWLDTGIEPVRISVNFSKVHLHNLQLAEDIIAVMEKYSVDSKYIEIELTETLSYENYQTLIKFVDTMKKKGIHTSIDDFGTGYSSLNLLKDLNVDIIKLDKSFLQNIEKRNKQDEIVIKNIVNMVKDLDMEVIAEGVETFDQADFLRNINCCMAQGFLYDRPLPQKEFQKRLTGERTYAVG